MDVGDDGVGETEEELRLEIGRLQRSQEGILSLDDEVPSAMPDMEEE